MNKISNSLVKKQVHVRAAKGANEAKLKVKLSPKCNLGFLPGSLHMNTSIENTVSVHRVY